MGYRCEARRGAPHKEREKAMTKEQRFVVEGIEQIDELTKQGADADGGQMAAAKA